MNNITAFYNETDIMLSYYAQLATVIIKYILYHFELLYHACIRSSGKAFKHMAEFRVKWVLPPRLQNDLSKW